MSSKTRKLIWSVPLMATLAVVGALAVFVALGLTQRPTLPTRRRCRKCPAYCYGITCGANDDPCNLAAADRRAVDRTITGYKVEYITTRWYAQVENDSWTTMNAGPNERTSYLRRRRERT